MPFRIGQWVHHNDEIAVVFARPEPDTYVLHYVNPDGTTRMRYDGPRGTEEATVSEGDLTPADWSAVPASRQPIDAEALAAIEAGTAIMRIAFQPSVGAQTEFQSAEPSQP